MWCSCGVSGIFQFEWPSGWEGVDISVKELVPVVVAAALCGGLWQGHHICFQGFIYWEVQGGSFPPNPQSSPPK